MIYKTCSKLQSIIVFAFVSVTCGYPEARIPPQMDVSSILTNVERALQQNFWKFNDEWTQGMQIQQIFIFPYQASVCTILINVYERQLARGQINISQKLMG